jgi:hypothetical protein
MKSLTRNQSLKLQVLFIYAPSFFGLLPYQFLQLPLIRRQFIPITLKKLLYQFPPPLPCSTIGESQDFLQIYHAALPSTFKLSGSLPNFANSFLAVVPGYQCLSSLGSTEPYLFRNISKPTYGVIVNVNSGCGVWKVACCTEKSPESVPQLIWQLWHVGEGRSGDHDVSLVHV